MGWTDRITRAFLNREPEDASEFLIESTPHIWMAVTVGMIYLFMLLYSAKIIRKSVRGRKKNADIRRIVMNIWNLSVC
uniref:hypothetical protein n=1 Tax=Agathobacter sp. TaxID=2021311 RepID=UPI0040575BF1